MHLVERILSSTWKYVKGVDNELQAVQRQQAELCGALMQPSRSSRTWASSTVKMRTPKSNGGLAMVPGGAGYLRQGSTTPHACEYVMIVHARASDNTTQRQPKT